jgi:LmbE family N-acetylglucosaminyl deacetylase
MDRRALAIFAHPDDVDFGAAGTVARWVDDGWDVRYVCVTRGQKGAWDAHMDVVTFLDWMDSEVFDSLDLRRALAREFRRHRPHRLLTMIPDPLPTERFVNHPDHRIVGQAALDITMTGGTTASIFPELLDDDLPPWRDCAQTWLMGPAIKPRAVDITGTIDRKLDAIRSHASQIGDRDIDTMMRTRLRDAGRAFGLTYAETFRVISYRR